MNKSCSFILAALALFVQRYECTIFEPQIKMVRPQLWYVNPSYTRALWYDVQKHNETYNNIGLHWEITRDLPLNLAVQTSVYVTNSNYGEEKMVLKDYTKVCAEGRNRHLLPQVVVLDESQLGGRCMKKGLIELKDMGQFRFEMLLPNIENVGKYFKVDYEVGNRFETVLIVTFYSEWGYHNDNNN